MPISGQGIARGLSELYGSSEIRISRVALVCPILCAMLRQVAINLVIRRAHGPDDIESIVRVRWEIAGPRGPKVFGRNNGLCDRIQIMVLPTDEKVPFACIVLDIMLDSFGDIGRIVAVNFSVERNSKGIGKRFDSQVWPVTFTIVLGMLCDDTAYVVRAISPEDLHQLLSSRLA
jgi:hypothetical protein